jgi:hypothetical protein
VDFFSAKCQGGPFTDARFGVCDDRPGLPAYVDTTGTKQWIATVDNSAKSSVTFTAIDKCVIQDDEEPGRGRCDAMLTTHNLLYLLELKDQQKSWTPHAIDQLESTIRFLLAHHASAVSAYRHKKAFACNRKHPAFAEIDHERRQRFFRNYGFRLDVQATVVMVC